MIVFPKAKINIGLRITGKRTDGYHDIETIFYPVNLCDALEFVVSTDPQTSDIITLTGIATGGDPKENLVMKIAGILRQRYSFPFLKIHLHKVIPVGAGLGGGSSDAVCFLKSVKRYFNLSVKEEDIEAIALETGSDCPFFIDAVPSYATGRGEVLQPVAPVLKNLYLVLVNPGVGINTREAYQSCKPERPSETLLHLTDSPVTSWKNLLKNDFEPFAFQKYPLIGEIKDELYKSGALFSSMSGSGSTIFGVFQAKPVVDVRIKGLIIWEGLM